MTRHGFELVYTLKPGEQACIYNDRLIVVHPNQSPFFIDLTTGERREIELGDEARDFDWQTTIEGICK